MKPEQHRSSSLQSRYYDLEKKKSDAMKLNDPAV